MPSSRVLFSLFLFYASLCFLFAESATLDTINKAFSFDGFGWDITGNTKACGKAAEDLKHNSSIFNYDEVFSSKLKTLSKKGGWLKIYPGVYQLTSPISIPSRVCFAGTHASKVVLQAEFPPEKGSSAISLKEVTKVSIFNITLINNATNSIYVKDSTYMVMKSVDATGATGSNRKFRALFSIPSYIRRVSNLIHIAQFILMVDIITRFMVALSEGVSQIVWAS